MPSPTTAAGSSALGAALAGLEIDPQRPIESLQNGLAKNAAVLIELFKSWDADNDGTVSRKEFCKGVKFLGVPIEKAYALELFDRYDPDKSGTMDFRELQKMLRPQVDAPKEKARAVARPQITFTLDAPPPLGVAAPELLRSVLKELPAKLRCRAPHFAADATSREACVLCVHSFWYSFCALHQPGSEAEQAALLKMMSQQVARLTLQRRCDAAAFFTHFPPLLAHAVLAALGRNGLLPPPAQPTSAAVLRHLIALLGGSLPPLLLNKHLELAARAAHASSGDAAFFTPPKPDAHARLPPPLATCALPALHGSPGAAPAAAAGSSPLEKAALLASASNSELLTMAAEAASSRARPRPRRVLADLHRQSPLVALLTGGAPPPAVDADDAPPSPPRLGLSSASSAPSLGTAARASPPPRFGATRFAQVQQSAPGFGGSRSGLGGVASHRSLRATAAGNSVARAAELEKTFRRANAQNRREGRAERLAAEEAAAALDAQQDEILGRPAAQLAEQSSRLAARIHDGDFRDRTWLAEVVIGVVT